MDAVDFRTGFGLYNDDDDGDDVERDLSSFLSIVEPLELPRDDRERNNIILIPKPTNLRSFLPNT